MLKLIDGTELTEEIKEAFKKGVTRAYIELPDGTKIDYDNYLQEIEIEDIRYNEETGNFIGEAVAKRVTLKIYNEDNSIDLEDKEFEVFLGAKLVDETMAWISYGNFIVQKPENNDTKETSEIEAFDYMCKFNQTYKPSVTFPCTYADIAQDVCNQCGVELGNSSFRNSQNAVLNNPFINNEQCRVVIKQIAKIAFSWARVATDNKLYFDFENKTMTVADEEINLDNYIDLSKNNETIPTNTIVLRNSNVEGENVTIIDEDLIKEYGVQKELVISEDYFAYSEEIRRSLIQAGKALFGLLYTPMKLSGIGTAYLENNDVIAIIDRNGNKRYSYCLNHTIKYNGVLYDNIESPAMTETETKYQNESSEDLARRRTEILVDKANQRIEAVVSDLDEAGYGSFSELVQDIEGIKTNVGIAADLTKTVVGINPLVLEKCLEGELQELRIKANNTIFNLLQPSLTLYPSFTVFPRGKTFLHIIHQEVDENDVIIQTTKVIDLNLSSGLKMYNSEIYDEFVYSASVNEGVAKGKVIRRVGRLEDGTLYPLSEENIEHVEVEDILLGKGTNIITLNNGYYGNMSAIFVQENSFTKMFATTYEVNSYITQLADEIDLMVKEKVGKNEIIADLNLAVKDGQGIIEIIGNVLKIQTDNFKLTEEGDMTANSGTIAGWTINKQYLGKGLAGIQGIGNTTSDDKVFYAGKGLGHNGNPAFYVTNKGNTHVKSLDIRGASSSDVGQIKVYSESSKVGTTITYSTVDAYYLVAGNGGTTPTTGKCMHGYDMGHDFRCRWNDSKLYFIVDDTNIGYVTTSSSDARLKKDITDIPAELMLVIEEVELKQFKLVDGNGKYKFGIIAQDLVNAFKKYGLDYREYEIISEVQVDLTDETLYFFIDYEQVLILKNQLLEDRVKMLENKVEKILNKLGEV